MPFQGDPTAAAYGLFQVVFASLDTRLARALVELCRSEEPGFTFALISGLPFGKRLQFFEDALKWLGRELSGPGEPAPEEVDYLKTACGTARRIAAWRNARIHAEVRPEEGFNALYDRNGARLVIDRAECDRMRNEAAEVRGIIEEHVPVLVGLLARRKWISGFLGNAVDQEASE